MKIQTSIFFILLAASVPAQCQEAPQARITFRVVDDEGKSVPKATVGMSTFVRWQPGDNFGTDLHDGPKGITDQDGVVRLTYPSKTGEFGYRVRDLEGYYRDRGENFRFKEVKDKRWQPWNPTIQIGVRKVVNPISMYAKKVNTLLPKPNQKYGYDLIAGDWVAPLGKGSISDLIFEVTGYYNNSKDYDSKLHVTFSNKGDGLLPFNAKPYRGSILLSEHEAPKSGYEEERIWRKICKPDQMSKDWIDDSREDQNYYFRVRTSLDKNGKVKSALYGKIYGDIRFYVGTKAPKPGMGFNYYLNPTPNDRNIEFSSSKNLFTTLKTDEQVTEP